MSDWFLNDLKKVVNDEILLPEFVKINDIKEMYDFCVESSIAENRILYNEEEFSERVEELIDKISDDLFDDNEW